jgi:hypothetical protein
MRANTPSANSSACVQGSRVARPSQSEPGTMRLAISAPPVGEQQAVDAVS